jgi:general secretion pathway protein K
MSIVRLQRLLSLPSIDIDPAAVNALIDWIDADATNTIPDGAENGYYMNLEQPYRTANQTLKSVSTLRLVKGFENADKLNALLPFVCAINAATTINVNTAPAEVLLSLDTAVTENDINAVLAARENTPFNSVGEFTAIGNLSSSVTSTSTISVSSQYFLLTTYIEISNARTTVYSIINRIAGNDASLVARMQNSL